MRIAMILPSLAKSGPGIQVLNIVETLESQGISVEFLFIKDCKGETLDIGAMKSRRITFSTFKKVAKEFDIIHSHGFFPDLFSCLLGFSFKKINRISTMHNFISEDFGHRYSGLKRKVFTTLWYSIIKFIPNIIVFTRVAKSHYSEKTSSKIIVIPSSIPLLKIAERSKNISNIPSEILSKIIDLKSRGFNIIGANSIITEVKGLDLIIRSLPQLDKCVAVLVGGGDDENKLKELSRSLNVQGRCIFVGFQSDPIPFLSYYDVYAAPSISESFGLSLFEAIACKIPVVCNSLTVFQELLTNDSVFFMDNTIDSFVLSINKALDSNETFLEKAYDLVRDNYDSHVVATKYIKLYEEIKDNARI